MEILYSANARTTGGRDGQGKSDDGNLQVTLAMPKAMGGNGAGTNPEQLFAVGYSACFIGAMNVVAAQEKIKLPADLHVDSQVDLGKKGQGYAIAVTLNVVLPGMDQASADKLVEQAHHVCPYSNATRGNIDVTLNVSV